MVFSSRTRSTPFAPVPEEGLLLTSTCTGESAFTGEPEWLTSLAAQQQQQQQQPLARVLSADPGGFEQLQGPGQGPGLIRVQGDETVSMCFVDGVLNPATRSAASFLPALGPAQNPPPPASLALDQAVFLSLNKLSSLLLKIIVRIFIEFIYSSCLHRLQCIVSMNFEE